MEQEVVKGRYCEVLREFYTAMTGRRVTTVEEIEPEVMQFLAGMEYRDMLKPIVVKLLRSGVGTRTVADVYGVSRGFVMRLKRRFKI